MTAREVKGQRPTLPPVIYLTGLPASGKSTLARGLAAVLQTHGYDVELLDSDEVREHLRMTGPLAYTPNAREWFYRALALMAARLARHGVIVLIAATANLRAYREFARSLVPDLCLVHVRCSPRECARRDPKGLWERAKREEIRNFPGVDAPYEIPEDADIIVDTEALAPDEALRALVEFLLNDLPPRE